MLVIVICFLVVLILIKNIIWFIHTDCKSKVCLVGKTALVTGGNSGIGYQIVLGLLQRGCRVVIADKVKDPNLLENIFKETGSRNVVFEYVDLSSLQSTREFADSIKNNEEKLDILVNNAGIGRDVLKKTGDGLDVIMQVNYFSTFLLTNLLVDLLKKSKGRIVFTSSVVSRISDLSPENLRTTIQSIDDFFHYPNSKLCCLIAGDIFAEKLKIYGVTSNTYHPGFVYTNIFTYGFKNESIVEKLKSKMGTISAFLFGKSPEQGAQTAIYLACANEVENVTGEFFFETKKTFKPKLARNRKFCQAVWDISEELVGLKPDEKI